MNLSKFVIIVQVEIAIRKAPDMTVPENRELIEMVAQQFEQISYSGCARLLT